MSPDQARFFLDAAPANDLGAAPANDLRAARVSDLRAAPANDLPAAPADDFPPRPDLELFAEAELPTRRGPLRAIVFRERGTGKEHVAAVKGEVRGREHVLTRIHSECLTSEILGSLKCDCRDQLEHALDLVGRAERGVVLYLRQEGRGIGLGNKIRAYALQARGEDTYQANRSLGFADDLRSYDVAAEMLRQLGVRSVDLITNNPLKVSGLSREGMPVRARVPSRSPVNPHNVAYLNTKRERTGHLLELPPR